VQRFGSNPRGEVDAAACRHGDDDSDRPVGEIGVRRLSSRLRGEEKNGKAEQWGEAGFPAQSDAPTPR
jgi:hypothetical protein